MSGGNGFLDTTGFPLAAAARRDWADFQSDNQPHFPPALFAP